MNLKDKINNLEPAQKNHKKSYLNYRSGKIVLGGRTIRYASRYEKNWMCFLQYLKDKGEIAEWIRNTTLYPFSKPAVYIAPKSGERKEVSGYIPDFMTIKEDGTFEIQEIKGWANNKYKAQMDRFKKEYPSLADRVYTIAQPEFVKIEKSLGEELKQYGWESVLRNGFNCEPNTKN